MEKTGNADKMQLSVIIVNWNTKDLLLNCIREFKREAAEFFTEIIVVDNASTDGSPDAVKNCFPDVILIRNTTNAGFARANNQGIRVSKGEYVCLMNTDIELPANSVTGLFRFIAAHQNIGLLGPRVLNRDGTLQFSTWRFDSFVSMFFSVFSLNRICPNTITYPMDRIRKVDYIAGCFWLIRKTAVEEVGLLDERFFFYGEDKDWCYRFHRKKWDVILNPDISIIHYGGGSSGSSSAKYSLMMEQALLLFAMKHFPLLKMVLYYFYRFVYHFVRVVLSLPVFLIKGSKSNHYGNWKCLIELLTFEFWRKIRER